MRPALLSVCRAILLQKLTYEYEYRCGDRPQGYCEGPSTKNDKHRGRLARVVTPYSYSYVSFCKSMARQTDSNAGRTQVAQLLASGGSWAQLFRASLPDIKAELNIIAL